MSLRYLLAALVATALANDALAQQPAEAPKLPFTLYGTLNANFQWTQARVATNSAQSVEPRTAVSTDSTNLGIRGTFDVREVL